MSKATESPPNLQHSSPATATQTMARIQALELHFPKSPMSDDERRVWFADYCRDLQKTDAEIAYACSRYRQDRHSRFFPTPGQLLGLINEVADARPRTNGRMVDGRYEPWGGACQCDRCMKKTPREGFYKAPREAYAADAQERRDLDYDMERRTADSRSRNPELAKRTPRDKFTRDAAE